MLKANRILHWWGGILGCPNWWASMG